MVVEVGLVNASAPKEPPARREVLHGQELVLDQPMECLRVALAGLGPREDRHGLSPRVVLDRLLEERRAPAKLPGRADELRAVVRLNRRARQVGKAPSPGNSGAYTCPPGGYHVPVRGENIGVLWHGLGHAPAPSRWARWRRQGWLVRVSFIENRGERVFPRRTGWKACATEETTPRLESLCHRETTPRLESLRL